MLRFDQITVKILAFYYFTVYPLHLAICICTLCCWLVYDLIIITRGQSNLTKSASRGVTFVRCCCCVPYNATSVESISNINTHTLSKFSIDATTLSDRCSLNATSLSACTDSNVDCLWCCHWTKPYTRLCSSKTTATLFSYCYSLQMKQVDSFTAL